MAYNKQNWADGPGGGTPISAARLQHLEDGVNAVAVLADALGSSPMARDGHSYQLLAAVIRNDGAATNYWQPLPESSNHRPINVTSVETITTGPNAGYIRVHHTPGAKMTVVTAAVPDETLARNGFHVGTSVTPTYTDIRLSQSAKAVSDYVSYDSTAGAWVSQDGVFTAIDFTNGVLTLTHDAIPLTSQYSVALESRGVGYDLAVSTTSSATTATQLKLDVREAGPEISDYVSYNGSAWVSARGAFTPAFSAGVLTLTHQAMPSVFDGAVALTPRGGATATYQPSISSAASSLTSTSMKVEFRDYAGALLTTPDTNMRVYVVRGRGAGPLAATPSTDMKFYITHGGGTRECDPAKIDTVKYPASNIWLIGFMGTD